MIIERMPANINTQANIEAIFRKILPSKMRSLSKWKSVDIQRISCEDEDLKRLSSYLRKQVDHKLIALDCFNNILNKH